MQVVRADVACDQVQVVVEGARAILDLEQAVAGVRVRIRAPVNHLGAVHGEAARVFRVGALVGHQEPEPADFRVGYRVKRIQVTAVQLDPLVPDVVRCHRMLAREQRNDLVMPEDYLAVRAENKSDIEEAPGEFGVPGLRLGHQENVPLPGQRAKVVRLGTRDVDRALPRELLVIEVQDFVVETLQGAFGDRDEPHRQVQAGQPRRSLDEVREMLEVRLDLVTVADAAHGGYQAQGLIGLDHDASLRPARPARHPARVLLVLPAASAAVCTSPHGARCGRRDVAIVWPAP